MVSLADAMRFFVTVHAKLRLKERFGIDLTIQLAQKINSLLNDYPLFLGYDKDKNEIYKIILDTQIMRVVVCKQTKSIVTFMY